MRHGRLRKLNRTRAPPGDVREHGLALIKHEQITTTLPKAKELRPVVEKLITLGKRATCTPAGWRIAQHARRRDGGEAVRRAGRALQDAAGRLQPRAEGRLPLRRRAPMAVIELVDRDVDAKGLDSGPKQVQEEEAAEA